MDNQEFSENVVEPEENTPADNKKKRMFLIILEVVLLIVVIILIVIFLNKRAKTGVGLAPVRPIVNNESNQVININTESQVTPSISPEVAPVTNQIIPGTRLKDDPRLYLPVPEQSSVSSEDMIPAGAIKISGTENGFSPSEFRVKAGDEIILALTSRISEPVVLTFYEPEMAAISIGCGPMETRWISFVVPTRPGEYVFKNDIIGKAGQTGKMIVEN